MLKIRLAKTGKKHAPAYRVVVIPKERQRNGRATEILGHFNPTVNPPSLTINKERLQYWLERGAQLTKATKKLIKGKYEFKSYRPKKAKSEEPAERSQEPKENRAQESATQEANT